MMVVASLVPNFLMGIVVGAGIIVSTKNTTITFVEGKTKVFSLDLSCLSFSKFGK